MISCLRFCTRATLATGALALSACSMPGLTIFSNDDPGVPLAAGETAAVHFFTMDANYDTGIQLQAGNSYSIDMTILSNWNDGPISENAAGTDIDELGFEDSQMRWQWVNALKRRRDHQWFELMLYQPDCAGDSRRGVSDLATTDAGSYTYVAACTGKLTLFVNDSYGFYLNNQGYANIAVTRLN